MRALKRVGTKSGSLRIWVRGRFGWDRPGGGVSVKTQLAVHHATGCPYPAYAPLP
jgi:hypothetical protein